MAQDEQGAQQDWELLCNLIKGRNFSGEKFGVLSDLLKRLPFEFVITHFLFVFLFWTSPVFRSFSSIEMSLKWHPLSQQWSYRTEISIT